MHFSTVGQVATSRIKSLAAGSMLALCCGLPAADVAAQSPGSATLTPASTSASTIQLSIAGRTVEAEVARTDEERSRGLMFRTSMPADRGMLFVFAQSAVHCMWMRNTLIPLDVAFLDEQGQILNIASMQPMTEDSHCAARPARYAIEMNKGWFASRQIKAGQRVSGQGLRP